jgi:excinuclease ABC subunit B
MAEDLTDYLGDIGIRLRYIHADVETIERVEIIRALRRGDFDVLVGINLLREGLDIPEVSLVAILDADKEGYLRSTRSLIQTIGRAARNVNGRVLMYADVTTESMAQAIRETDRRRDIQRAFNQENGITPESVRKAIGSPLIEAYEADYTTVAIGASPGDIEDAAGDDPVVLQRELRQAMREAAEALEFERAAEIRDRLQRLEAGMRPGSSPSAGEARGRDRKPAMAGGRTARRRSARGGFRH